MPLAGIALAGIPLAGMPLAGAIGPAGGRGEAGRNDSGAAGTGGSSRRLRFLASDADAVGSGAPTGFIAPVEVDEKSFLRLRLTDRRTARPTSTPSTQTT